MISAIPAPSKLIAPYCVSKGQGFRLKDFDPGDAGSVDLSEEEQRLFQEKALHRVKALQQLLFADARWSVLFIIQGMDAAGKDSLIRHVMSGVNPQGCQVSSFKQPSAEDLSHDYLWRASKLLPPRGQIGIFNRSYYEEVLVPRIHPHVLEAQNLPLPLLGETIWDNRLEDISCYERYLARNGVVIRKLYLHVSKDEQKKRFLRRLEDPKKNWKFSVSDVRDREFWDGYIAAYETAIGSTASKYAPWYILPADHKWYTRLIASSILVDTLESLDLAPPQVRQSQQAELKAARERLLAEAD